MIRYFYIFFVCTTCILFANCAGAKDLSDKQVSYIPIGKVITKPGLYKPYYGACEVELVSNGMGGFIVLSVSQMGTTIIKEVKDVTGIVWVTISRLVYTVSPIYGNPGVYVLDCNSKVTKRIVAPKNINATYQNGADYFELNRLAADKIYFYYAPDVDSVIFKEFRSATFLFYSNLDGSDVKKADDF